MKDYSRFVLSITVVLFLKSIETVVQVIPLQAK
jgi:hypothetical protein